MNEPHGDGRAQSIVKICEHVQKTLAEALNNAITRHKYDISSPVKIFTPLKSLLKNMPYNCRILLPEFSSNVYMDKEVRASELANQT